MLLAPLLFAPLLHAADKSACTARELKRQDCRLERDAYKVKLLSESIAREDGVRRTVDEMLLRDSVWEKVRFDKIGGRLILQLWLWDKGQGEAEVQKLHWFVAEFGPRKLHVLAEGVVRRRRLKTPKPDYIYDAWEKHGLKARVDGELEWTLGTQTKTLPAKKAGEHGV